MVPKKILDPNPKPNSPYLLPRCSSHSTDHYPIAYAPITNEETEIESSHRPTGSPFLATGSKYALTIKNRKADVDARNSTDLGFGLSNFCSIASWPGLWPGRSHDIANKRCFFLQDARKPTGRHRCLIWLYLPLAWVAESFACCWVGFQWASMPSSGCTT